MGTWYTNIFNSIPLLYGIYIRCLCNICFPCTLVFVPTRCKAKCYCKKESCKCHYLFHSSPPFLTFYVCGFLCKKFWNGSDRFTLVFHLFIYFVCHTQ